MRRPPSPRRVSVFWVGLLVVLGLALLVRGLQLYGARLAGLSRPAPFAGGRAPARPDPAPTAHVPVRVPDAPLVLESFHPLAGRGPWSTAEERQTHRACADLDAASPDPEPNPWGVAAHPRWRETCGDAPLTTRVTLRGSGFASPPSANRVRFGDVPAEVVAGDAHHLVVEPAGGPRLAPIAVETPPAADGDAPRRATMARPFLFIGPPQRVELVEGDGQSAVVGSALGPIAVRVEDAHRVPVPGERVWFWVRSRERRRELESPIFVEAETDAMGVARAQITLGETPAQLRVEAAVVNPPREGPGRVESVFAEAEALPRRESLTPLLAGLSSVDGERRKEAARALARLGPTARSAAPALVAASRHPDPELRWLAAEALARIGAPEALEALERIVRDTTAYRRQEAAMLLGDQRDRAGEALPPLLALVEETPSPSNFAERLAALDALGRLGPSAAGAVPAVLRVLGEERADLRKKAIQTLRRIRPAAEDVAPALRALLEDEDVGVAREARSALESSFGGVAPMRLEAVPAADMSVVSGQRFELTVRLLDHEGHARPGERVYFAGPAWALTLESESALTDAGGAARVRALAGQPGEYRVTARFGTARVVVRLTVRAP